MLKIIVIGNIGQDAAVKEWNGQFFAAFSVANTESYTDSKGIRHETTEWISCLKRVKDGNSALVPLLRKGMKVYIEGPLSKKMFEKNGQRECGLNCNVSFLELLTPKNASAEPTVAPTAPIANKPAEAPISDGTDDLPF